MPHDLAIFARAGLGLVGVDDQVGGTTVADLFGFGKRAARRNVSGWTGVWRGESRNRTPGWFLTVCHCERGYSRVSWWITWGAAAFDAPWA